MLLANKVAIITGSTKGIGEAAAIAMAKDGAKVLVTGREHVAGQRVVDTILEIGGDAFFVEGDLMDPSVPSRLVEAAVQHWGRIDIIVNNAAMTCIRATTSVTHEDWDKLFQVNVKSAFFLIQAALPYLLETKGAVINVSSINGARNAPNNLVYDTMKAALNHMTSGFTIDYRDRGVRFNALLPAGVDTLLLENAFKAQISDPQQLEETMEAVRQSSKLAQPGQIADMIVLLASDRASWLNGASIPLEGGYSLGHP